MPQSRVAVARRWVRRTSTPAIWTRRNSHTTGRASRRPARSGLRNELATDIWTKRTAISLCVPFCSGAAISSHSSDIPTIALLGSGRRHEHQLREHAMTNWDTALPLLLSKLHELEFDYAEGE